MSAQVCPVCGGKGLVPNGFYLSDGMVIKQCIK